MTEERAKRKLTAILSADVKGYSRLMGEDELSTVEILKRYREIISSLVQQYRGRVVDSPGDNVLTEFSSVVDAVECAVKIQEDLKEKNASLPENRRMEFRIGVNLGDVLDDEGRIYGDGVNVAARVEGLAEGGGICISRTAFDQVKNKLKLGYEYLGEHSVKNIAEPVCVYKVLIEPEYEGKVIGEKTPKPKRWRWAALAIGSIIVVGSWALWNFHLRPPPIEPASMERLAFPLPEKPSIAVLPFDNMSGDPEQEYFCDGLTEEIISALSMIPDLFVIARNSTFTYKGKPVKIHKVSEDLGVRYVLEGSLRKSGDRVRITAQLIDALAGKHLWAERYEPDLRETFALQDEITKRVVNAMQVELTEGEAARLQFMEKTRLDLYLKGWQAIGYLMRLTKEDNIRARQLVEKYIALAPESPAGWTLLAEVNLMDVWLGLSKSPGESVSQAEKMAKKAIDLTVTPWSKPHMTLSRAYLTQRKHENAIAEAEVALALAPNSAMAHVVLGGNLMWAGRHEEAIPFLKQALRLDPFPTSITYTTLCVAYRCLGRYEEAVTACEKSLQLAPDSALCHVAMAAAYSLAGRDEEARAAVHEALRLDPRVSLEFVAKTAPFKNQADLKRGLDALREAGLK